MKKILLIAFFVAIHFTVFSQAFLDGNFDFSTSKESYITLKDSSEVVGFIDKIERKKGLIKQITLKDAKGVKTSYSPDQIDHMYIAPSKWDKFSNGNSKMNDFSKWDKDMKLNKAHIKAGYALFESSEVIINDEKLVLLMQLLNPAYASKIRVYFDPRASESPSFGMGGLSMTGGDAKSYYVKKGDAVAFKLAKKNYKDELKNLYGDCSGYETILTEDDKLHWSDLSIHIFNYTNKCNQ